VFVSYRHEERHGVHDAEGYNAQHRAWVNDFARALGSWNVDVVWDERLRQMFKPYSNVDPSKVPFLAELSTLCLQVAQTFMPILTRGYLERATATRGSMGYGTVTEEWRHGIAECAAGRSEIVTVVREWPIPDYSEVPAPVADGDAWDFRFVAAGRDEVELLADRLNGIWEVERPRFDLSFREWIEAYLRCCVDALDMPWPGIEHWDCNFDRARVFVEELAPIWLPPLNPDGVGSQRDLREASEALQIETIPANPSRLPPDPKSMRQMEEVARKEMRAVMQAVVDSRREPFDFREKTPGGRGSDGLYFGPTLRQFSYLHPLDPRLAELQR
jgi:hypothetical protein